MSIGNFEYIHNGNEDVMLELLSFCDFRSLVRLGKTCRHLKLLSNCMLDRWVEIIIEGKKKEQQQQRIIIGEESFMIRKGWSKDFQSRPALIEKAIRLCNTAVEMGFIDESSTDYEEDRARYLLGMNNIVDVDNFLTGSENDEAMYGDSEFGWNIRIEYDQSSSSSIFKPFAANQIIGIIAEETEKNVENTTTTNTESSDYFYHCAMCLLRKTIFYKYSICEYEWRHPLYPARGKGSFLMMKLPNNNNNNNNNRKFELIFEHVDDE